MRGLLKAVGSEICNLVVGMKNAVILLTLASVHAGGGTPSAAAAGRLADGMNAAKNGDSEAALKLLREAAALEPSWSKPLLKVAHVHAFVTNDRVQAEAAYRDAIAVAPEQCDAHYFLGRLQSDQEKPDEALGHLETALELARASNNVAPSDSDVTVRHCETELAKVRYALGDALTERNDWSGASEHFAAAAELRPQWATPHARLGESYQARGRFGEAREAYAQALTLDPTDAVAEYNSGAAARSMGDASSAVQHFTKAAELRHASGEASLESTCHFNAALMYRQLDDDSSAEVSYRRSIDASPSARAYYNLGNLLRDRKSDSGGSNGGSGSEEEAARCYESAIQLDPSAADAYQQLRRLRNVANVVTTPRDHPLVTRRKLELPSGVLSKLRSDVLSHPWAVKQNRLSSSFKRTKGFVVRFSKEGFENDFKQHEHLRCLVPYFEHAVLDGANVFVMNVLVVPPRKDGSAAADDEDEDEEEGMQVAAGGSVLAVQRHLDNTLAICTLEHSFVAHQVDVLYLAVPPSMVGGELCVWDPPVDSYSTIGSDKGGLVIQPVGDELGVTPSPNEVVTPQEGLHVSFRGDAKHGVRAWSTQEGGGEEADGGGASGCRVSLVLEQYVVPESLMHAATRFEVLRGE